MWAREKYMRRYRRKNIHKKHGIPPFMVWHAQTTPLRFVYFMEKNHWIYLPFRANMYLPKGKKRKWRERA